MSRMISIISREPEVQVRFLLSRSSGGGLTAGRWHMKTSQQHVHRQLNICESNDFDYLASIATVRVRFPADGVVAFDITNIFAKHGECSIMEMS